jgi:DNA mismatch repair protein MutL
VGKIRILPEQVVNQIAAGEVVERAASALKELMENSIDAGATRIQVLINGSGRDLIQVVDDGSGMSREDLHLALERHATSKLTTADDLYSIRSFGFRGEALPSIASVSVLELQSRTDPAPSGTAMRLQGGEIVHDSPVAMPRGTSISVHSLFFNTPARASFLKSASTELSHIVRTYRQYAIAYPEISFSLTLDNSPESTLPRASFLTRLDDMFGAGFQAKLLPLHFAQAGVQVGGAIGKSELFRKSRGEQYLYLNRRPIMSPMLHSAVKAALRELLEPNEWPFYIVMLELDPREIDVNVHPAKLEVKFADEKLVHAAVYRAIRSVLPEQLSAEHRAPLGGYDAARPLTVADFLPQAPVVSGQTAQLWDAPRLVTAQVAAPETEVSRALKPGDPPPSSTSLASEHPALPEFTALLRPAIYQLHHKYLVSQIRSGIAVIDQHAAHERVLYERALRSYGSRSFNSQQLLFPMLLELSVEHDALFAEIQADLVHFGFQIRAFGPRAYSIEAVPAGLKRASEAGLISSILDEYSEFRRANFSARDALAAGFACKAAIRTGDELTSEEMTSLMDELFATKFPLTCPHGRPTVIHLTLNELDRRFKRTT